MIYVKHLSKIYKTAVKKPGLLASITSIFNRTYKQIHAVENISFDIEQGELIGFIGPNGAGKTTTLKMLSGLLRPSKGELSVLGFTPSDRKSNFLKQISLVMGQKNQLWWDLPTIESFNLNADIYEIDQTEYKKRLSELVDLFGIQHVLHQPVRNLSLGERMKCEFVASLLHTPKILFLDEPTIGLDVTMQKQMRAFIRQYNQKYHATILLTSHYMDDVMEICKRVIIINHGSLVFDGTLSDIVKKYANYKILEPIFNSPVTKDELSIIGKVVEFNYPKAVITIPQDQVSQKAALLLEKYTIDDLDINEPKLEDIIPQILSQNPFEQTL